MFCFRKLQKDLKFCDKEAVCSCLQYTFKNNILKYTEAVENKL